MKPINKKSKIYKLIMVIILSIVYTLGVSFFLNSSHIISTGLVGLVQIIHYKFNFLNFGFLYLLLNIPGIILGIKYLGKEFTFYSMVSVLMVTLSSNLIEFLPINTVLSNDRMINCIFAAVLIGMSVGGLLKIGASSGGTDFYALYLFDRYAIPFSYVNISFNVLIILLSILFFDLETALFTLFFIFVREIVINLFYTNNKKLTVWIVGENLDDVKKYIHNSLGRGTSIFKEVKGGYTDTNKEVIMVVLNQFQFVLLKEYVIQNENEVFITAARTYDVYGNYRVNK